MWERRARSARFSCALMASRPPDSSARCTSASASSRRNVPYDSSTAITLRGSSTPVRGRKKATRSTLLPSRPTSGRHAGRNSGVAVRLVTLLSMRSNGPTCAASTSPT